jgi:hypothetical protein
VTTEIAWRLPRSSFHPKRFYFRHCIPEHVRGIADAWKRIINLTSNDPFSATIIWLLADTGQMEVGSRRSVNECQHIALSRVNFREP